jgi:hypothetical protein
MLWFLLALALGTTLYFGLSVTSNSLFDITWT